MSLHDIRLFMSQMTHEISSEYARLQARAKEDPGTAGSQGEETWAQLLRRWTPSGYHVVPGGRIIDTDGNTSPQVDILILHPSYPPGLLGIKHYLAPAVVAAFECKLTLTRAHIKKSSICAALLEDMMTREGRPPGEFFYGVLAHSHAWNQRSNPAFRVQQALSDYGEEFTKRPGQCIDALCVANLGAWLANVATVLSQVELTHMGPLDSLHPKGAPNLPKPDSPPEPITRTIAHLLNRIGDDQNGVDRVAGYLRKIGSIGTEAGVIRTFDDLSPDEIPSHAVDITKAILAADAED
ncbi:hypothetical protein SUDANB105_04065 [Streptomyces sp. enrichment culture]|uniref:DUF6602 domain-containing protein n=1 Tax=Streptomyces sp. enrichment culture TaxID=1795815 RepID=UPI003F563D5C